MMSFASLSLHKLTVLSLSLTSLLVQPLLAQNFALPDPFTYNARGLNFTLSNYRAPLGAPSAFAENILECQYSLLLQLQQSPSLPVNTTVPGASYTCSKTDIVLNATNVPTIFQGAPSAIGQTLGRRGLSLNSTGNFVTKEQGAIFSFSYINLANVMDGLNLGALRFGDQGLPAFDWEAFGLIQGTTPGVQNRALSVAKGSWT